MGTKLISLGVYDEKLSIATVGSNKKTEVGAGWVLVYNKGKVIMKTEHGPLNITSTNCTMETFKSLEALQARITVLGLIDKPEEED